MPILFSEAVNLHPLVIILSVIVFGGMGLLGRVFRHTAGDAGEGGDPCPPDELRVEVEDKAD